VAVRKTSEVFDQTDEPLANYTADFVSFMANPTRHRRTSSADMRFNVRLTESASE
jgi:hypothetical protein